MASHEDLVRRARVGDEIAFDELWRRHSAELLDFVWRAAGPGVHAPDVLTGAYLDASRSIAEFEDRGPESFGRWLRGYVEARLSAPAAEMQAAAREAMARLSPRHREVLRLLQEERLTPESAAVRMGSTPDAVRRLHESALARFAELIRSRKRDGA